MLESQRRLCLLVVETASTLMAFQGANFQSLRKLIRASYIHLSLAGVTALHEPSTHLGL